MRVKITLTFEKLVIPVGYQHIIQGFIYNNLEKNSTYYHDLKGISVFNFSELFGKKTKLENTLVFDNLMYFYLSTYDLNFLISITSGLLHKHLSFFRQNVYCSDIDVVDDCITASMIEFKTLSPVTIHTTEEKKTIYYKPSDPKFLEYINRNLSHKLGSEVSIILNVEKEKKYLTKFKNLIIIEAYYLEGTIIADPKVLKCILDVGLGDRNSQGFGMIEIKK